jgi:hypothetical protein
MSHDRNKINPLRTQASSSDRLLNEIDQIESLALTANPLVPRRGLRDLVLRATSTDGRSDGYVERVARFFDIDIARSRSILASTLDVQGVDWVDDPNCVGTRLNGFTGGANVSGAQCFLVHMDPGVAFPSHVHLGDEWCLFLGGRTLEAEQEWNPGDLVLKPAGSEHPVLTAIDSHPTIIGIVLQEGIRLTDRAAPGFGVD